MRITTTPYKFIKQSGLKFSAIAKEMDMSPQLLRYYLSQDPVEDDVLGNMRLAVRKITERICEGIQLLQP